MLLCGLTYATPRHTDINPYGDCCALCDQNPLCAASVLSTSGGNRCTLYSNCTISSIDRGTTSTVFGCCSLEV